MIPLLKLRKTLYWAIYTYSAACLLSVTCYLYFICIEYVPSRFSSGVFSVYPVIISWNILILSSCFLALTLISRLYPTRKAGEIPQYVFLSFVGAMAILALLELLIGLMRPGGPLIGAAFEALSFYMWLAVLHMPDMETTLRLYSIFRSLFPLVFLSLIWLAFSLPYLLRGGRFTFRHPEEKT